MYEHPYLHRQVVLFEQEQIAQAAERHRFLREHADQFVPYPDGAARRMLRRLFRRADRRTALTPRNGGCEQTVVAAQ